MPTPSKLIPGARPRSKSSSSSDNQGEGGRIPAATAQSLPQRPSSSRLLSPLSTKASPTVSNTTSPQAHSSTFSTPSSPSPSSPVAGDIDTPTNPALATPTSPSHNINHSTPGTNTPRKNARRRYTPRQIPPSAFRAAQEIPSLTSMSSTSSRPHQSSPEPDVAQFLSLTQKLNGQMDGLADYKIFPGPWESGILYIDAPTNTLNRHYGTEGSQQIISDLRGCRVDKVHTEDGRTVLDIRLSASTTSDSTTPETRIILKPPMSDVDKWFAALYKWRSVTRSPSTRSLKSLESNTSNPPSSPETATPPRRVLDVKLGPMVLLPSRRVNCHLKDNGMLRIFEAVPSATKQLQHQGHQRGDKEDLLYRIHLYGLSRSAIQILDPSLSSSRYAFVIHASFREEGAKSYEMRKMPLFLSLETRTELEVWFVLLRCFAIPEIYGPPSVDPLDAFRCHRSLWLRVVQGRRLRAPASHGEYIREKEMDSHCEIILSGEIRGRTSIKKGTYSPLWMEDFQIIEFPDHVEEVYILLRCSRRHRDLFYAKASLQIGDVELGTLNQEWIPAVWAAPDMLTVERVGELDIKFKLEEHIILMSRDYTEIRKLLLDFNNRITLDIAHNVQDLEELSDRLLHIFLADHAAAEWLVFLANEEITNHFARMTSPPLVPSDTASEGAEEHLQQALKQEATRTLFRANSLFTKAIMKFMEKVGGEYLEETIGPYVRHVVANAHLESCEVDPAHLKPGEDIDENWTRLLRHTREILDRILTSAASCPPEFKIIFSKIRTKVVESAGNVPTITFAKYTCISAFIFLRFFMPACLNPHLFGIVRELPDDSTRRTLLLISKGLQGVANMSGFGGKEKWILKMATLSAEYEDQFTDYIDQICDTTYVTGPRQVAQYSGPALVRSRLDPLSQEGIPTLPFLIDQPRELAGLVKLWNKAFLPITSTPEKKPRSVDLSKLNEATRAFNAACIQLEERTTSLMESAVEREESDLSEGEIGEEEMSPRLTEVNMQNHHQRTPSAIRISKKASSRRQYGLDEESSSSPPKRVLDAVWPPAFLKKGKGK